MYFRVYLFINSRTYLQIIHPSSQDAGGSNCKMANRALKTSKPLRRKALRLHLFCQHTPKKKDTQSRVFLFCIRRKLLTLSFRVIMSFKEAIFMSLLHFSDLLRKAGLDPAKVKLIRHSRSDADFNSCYQKGPEMIQEYTRVQKPDFSKGYDYWCVFISESSTTARFFACYRVNGSVPDAPALKPS